MLVGVRQHGLVPNVRRIEGGQMTGVDRFVIDEMCNGLLGCHRGKELDILRRSAEPGAFQQMRGTFIRPVIRTDRRKVADPAFRAGRSLEGVNFCACEAGAGECYKNENERDRRCFSFHISAPQIDRSDHRIAADKRSFVRANPFHRGSVSKPVGVCQHFW